MSTRRVLERYSTGAGRVSEGYLKGTRRACDGYSHCIRRAMDGYVKGIGKNTRRVLEVYPMGTLWV